MTKVMEATDKCPNWCTDGSDEYPCRGEHRTSSDLGYISASAGLGERTGLRTDGEIVPRADVGLSWPQPWGSPVSVWIHLLSEDFDASVDFTVGEALRFYAAFGDMLGRILEAGVKPGLMLTREEVAAMFADIDSPRRALGIEQSGIEA